jgi:outer membrane protein assembly factor BamB
MRRRGLLAVVLAVAGAWAAGEDYLPAAELEAVQWRKSWQLPLPLEADQYLTDLYLVEDQLYAATADGYVFAIHAGSGAIRWLRQVTQEGFRVSRPCQAGERVIFATPTTVVHLDRLTGKGLYQQRLDFPCGTAPVSDGSRYFLGGLDRRLYAFSVENPLQRWAVTTSGPITVTPAVLGPNVYFASDDGSVYSCAAYDKAFRWSTRTFGPIVGAVVVSAEGVFVPSQDQSLYLFDLTYGRLRWRARFSGPLFEPPVLAGGLAFQYSPQDGLAAVEVAVGAERRVRWVVPGGRMLLALEGSQAFVLKTDQSVAVVGLEDGQVRAVILAPGFTLGAPEMREPAIYLASRDGRVFCARPRSVPLVQPEDLRAAIAGPEVAEAPGAGSEGAAATSREAAGEGGGRQLPPIGGKSKISKSFGRAGGTP